MSVGAQEPLLSVDNLATHFPVKGALWRAGGGVVAVDGVSFTVARGEAFGLVGESGSGKSTLARTLMRLHKPTAGTAFFSGIDLARASERDLRPVRRDMQMIFQDTKSSLNPRLRVRGIIAEPLITHGLDRDRARSSASCTRSVSTSATSTAFPTSSRADSDSASALPARSP